MTRGPYKTRPLEEKLLRRVRHTESGCWEWTGARDSQGYGSIRHLYVVQSAHRASYKAFVGPVPDGLQLDHLCRNRACINPEHLEPVTCRENTLRGVGPSAVNAKKTHCPAGHPLIEGNLMASKRPNHRECRTCRRDYSREYMRARRARSRIKDAAA